MFNILEFNKDFKRMYKTNLIKLNGEYFEIGSINSSNGQNENNSKRIRLIDYISVKPNSKYFIQVKYFELGLTLI